MAQRAHHIPSLLPSIPSAGSPTIPTPLCSSQTPPFFFSCCREISEAPAWLKKGGTGRGKETPNYLTAVKVKLNNPGMGKAGLCERHKKHLPQGQQQAGSRCQQREEPGMSWQTPGAGLGRRALHIHQPPRAARGINQTQRGRGEKSIQGGARGRRGNEKAARGRGKARSKAEIHQR